MEKKGGERRKEYIYTYMCTEYTNAHRGIEKEDGRKRKRGMDDWVILCED